MSDEKRFGVDGSNVVGCRVLTGEEAVQAMETAAQIIRDMVTAREVRLLQVMQSALDHLTDKGKGIVMRNLEAENVLREALKETSDE
jgi:16S rRNA G527 N7-methylase RsmG